MRWGTLLAAASVAVVPSLAAQGMAIGEADSVLHALVETYGASGAEGPVRDLVKQLLPRGVVTRTDTAGNLLVQFGRGKPLTVFIAHMDEIGWRVSSINDDGTVAIMNLGGFFSSFYEGRPALIHTGAADVPAVFVPRDSVGRSPSHAPPSLRVDPGTGTRAGTIALGVQAGATVTMPKSYQRLAGTRATGRSFDDRVGVTALILAARRLAVKPPRHAVLLIWSVREEIGLEGASAAAAALGGTPAAVHAIDTFVSADAPLEIKTYGDAPLGQGAVIRAVDNSNVAPAALVDASLALAARDSIPLQLGATSGGNDGSVFAAWGVPDVPYGWPLRYSHSPAEVVDLRDVVALARLVESVAR